MSKIDELTAFEASQAEKAAGVSIGVLEKPTEPSVGILGALAWVHIKRGEPELTYEAYMKRTPASEVADYLFGEDEEAVAVDEAGFPAHAGGDEGSGGDGEGDVLSGDGRPAE